MKKIQIIFLMLLAASTGTVRAMEAVEEDGSFDRKK